MCKHQFKYNQEQDFVFCAKCGERWFKKEETTFIPYRWEEPGPTTLIPSCWEVPNGKTYCGSTTSVSDWRDILNDFEEALNEALDED